MSHFPEYVDKNLPMTFNDEIMAITENNQVKSKTLTDPATFDLILEKENYIREKMYQDNFKDHLMNTDPNYNLIKIDQLFWENLVIDQPQGSDLLFTQGPMLEKAAWEEIQERLEKLKRDIQPNIYIAGGALFSILFGLDINDIDLFICKLDKKAATELIHDFIKKKLVMYRKKEDKYRRIICSMTRTKNAITLLNSKFYSRQLISKEYQIILRLYRSLSEILHGFDVDCCSIGFDGQDLWMTQRTYYALTRGYNQVNFDRLSPSYEYRLAKYGTRGMRIKIPNFDVSKIKLQRINEDIESIEHYTDPTRRYLKIINAKGIDILIGLDDRYSRSKKATIVIEKLSMEHSDYSEYPYKRYDGCKAGSDIKSLFEYLMNDKGYPTYDKYRSCLRYYYLGDISDSSYQEYKEISEFYEDDLEDPELLKEDNLQFYQEGMKLSSILPHCGLCINSLPKTKYFYFFKLKISKLDKIDLDIAIDTVLHLPQFLYDGLAIIKPWDIPRQIDYKTINPGEQMTNTFNVTVLKDYSVWYKGAYYNYE